MLSHTCHKSSVNSSDLHRKSDGNALLSVASFITRIPASISAQRIFLPASSILNMLAPFSVAHYNCPAARRTYFTVSFVPLYTRKFLVCRVGFNLLWFRGWRSRVLGYVCSLHRSFLFCSRRYLGESLIPSVPSAPRKV